MFLGRKVRPGIDPDWLPTDAGLAVAWQQNQREACRSCGTRPDEWQADRDAYVSDTHYCRGCELLAQQRESDAVPTDKDGRPLPGYHAYLMPRPMWEALHPDDLPGHRDNDDGEDA